MLIAPFATEILFLIPYIYFHHLLSCYRSSLNTPHFTLFLIYHIFRYRWKYLTKLKQKTKEEGHVYPALNTEQLLCRFASWRCKSSQILVLFCQCSAHSTLNCCNFVFFSPRTFEVALCGITSLLKWRQFGFMWYDTKRISCKWVSKCLREKWKQVPSISWYIAMQLHFSRVSFATESRYYVFISLLQEKGRRCQHKQGWLI